MHERLNAAKRPHLRQHSCTHPYAGTELCVEQTAAFARGIRRFQQLTSMNWVLIVSGFERFDRGFSLLALLVNVTEAQAQCF